MQWGEAQGGDRYCDREQEGEGQGEKLGMDRSVLRNAEVTQGKQIGREH